MADDAPAERPVPRAAIVRAGLTPGAAVLLVAAVVTALVLADAFVVAHRTIGWVVACGVIALLIDPVVTLVARVLPRWLAVVVVLLVVLTVVASLIIGLASDLTDSLDELRRNAPLAARSLEDRYDWMATVDVAQRVEEFVDELHQRVRRSAVSQAVGTAPTYVVTGVLMLFLLAYGRRYFQGFANQFGEARRARINQIGRDAVIRGRRYLLAAVGQAIVAGAIIGGTCWVLDLPAAFSLGFLAGALAVVPLLGVIVGGTPALLLAVGLEGWRTALWVSLAIVVVQVVEAAVVRPFVDARSVRVGPTVPIIVGLLGFELYGVGGAAYAIAVAVIALAALDSAGHDDDGATDPVT